YGFLANNVIDGEYVQDLVATNARVGVPYSEEMIGNALADFVAQADPLGDSSGLEERYGADAFGTPVNVRNFDGQASLTEMDALIAYMQVLGTMVDFSTFTPVANR
ncbi:MAG TPA: cbb3-type cytochrome c oxidase subunit II, partial [Tabrizicola sp.]|nr:cbb3-type cytochrome c oxidase subunit II [Tabrizicola sp.]